MKSIDQITAYKTVASLNMEELAAWQRSVQARGGVLFARSIDGEQKTAARERVLNLFTPDRWPNRLHMLTMPGVQWRFERKLLGAREVGWFKQPTPRMTYFTSIESDRALYFASVTQMPGLNTPNAELKRTKPYSFAEMGLKTRYASFFFANMDDLMALALTNGWSGWDAVWLDYTGPLTIERLALIARFYKHCVRSILVITSLKARFNETTTQAIAASGGHSAWLRNHLEGELLHDLEYFDTSAIAQFAIRKVWRSPLI